MDDYMFRSYVKDCKTVTEATSYLEILNYDVSWLSLRLRLWTNWLFVLRVVEERLDDRGGLSSFLRRDGSLGEDEEGRALSSSVLAVWTTVYEERGN